MLIFAAIAKSNSVLIGCRVLKDNRKNLGAIIRRARILLHKLNLYTHNAVLAPDLKVRLKADSVAVSIVN